MSIPDNFQIPQEWKEILWFVCIPLSTHGKRKQNIKQAKIISNWLINAGLPILPPTVVSEELHKLQSRTEDEWYEITKKWLRMCGGIIMCPNWSKSVGCRNEHELALTLHKKRDFKIIDISSDEAFRWLRRTHGK